jgi:hypothetical protein
MRFLKLVPVLVAAGALGGCVSSTDIAYPLTGDPVNPTPPRGYKVQCHTSPTFPNLFGDDHMTDCRGLIAPASAVIVAKG